VKFREAFKFATSLIHFSQETQKFKKDRITKKVPLYGTFLIFKC